MICDFCEPGLGIVDQWIFRGGQFVDIIQVPCPECRGVGSFCGYCMLNAADCECDEPESPPRPRRPDFF
jgi:hypothetical protein